MRATSKKLNVPFTQIANQVINSNKISLRDKGLWVYIQSKPDGWEFAAKRIAADQSKGIYDVLAGLKNLEQQGFLKRHKQPDGHVIYELLLPIDEKTKPDVLKAKVDKTQSGFRHTISNKEKKVIKRSNVV